MDTFMAEYAKHLERAVKEYPEEYKWPLAVLPQQLGEMRAAIGRRAFVKDTRAMRATCRALGIKCTYRAIANFIANHV